MVYGLGAEKLYDGARCHTIVVSFHYNVEHFHTEEGHCNNIELNIPDNASLVVYQATLAGHWLVMGLKIDNSWIDARLSKMEVTIENIVSLVSVSNLVVN
jgi:hypothetical protein